MKKILIIPALLLTSGLVLTGCTDQPAPNPSPSASEEQGELDPGFVEVPENVSYEYINFVTPLATLPDDPNFTYFRSVGATTYSEDDADRTVTIDNYNNFREEETFEFFDKVFGEVTSDIDTSAVNISRYLAENPDATVETIPADELIVNRYPKLVETVLMQDPDSKMFFVIGENFSGEERGDSLRIGQVVPQDGITPPEVYIPE